MMMFIISCDEINFVYFFWWPFHGCKSMMKFIYHVMKLILFTFLVALSWM
jgi:hypothetical protein